MIPGRPELKRFSKEHPFVSLAIGTMLAFTVVDVMSSFTLPKGKGPFSTKSGAMPAVVSSVDGLAGSTSTSTSTSTSHPPHIVREALMNNNLAGFGMAKSQLGSTSTTTSTSSTHLPPSLRRRMMARTLETEVSGSHLGKQELSSADATQRSGMDGYDSMFGLSGFTPETGSGWTE